MNPLSYSSDAQRKAEDLVSLILESSSPARISAACSAVDSYIRHYCAEQSRWFFYIAFPALICKIFGFEESKATPVTGWIDFASSASHDGDIGDAVFNLLSPGGALMSSISSVDRVSLVKYVFPVERLPEWVRFVLATEKDTSLIETLCPLFRGRIKEGSSQFQVQLNVWEYYMFWFAYYPVCRGSSGSASSATSSIRPGGARKFRFNSWASSIPVFSSGARRGHEQKTEGSFYLRLLYAYLCWYIPSNDADVKKPHRGSLFHSSSSHESSIRQRADFLYHTLVHFWLVYNDFSPLSSDVRASSPSLRTVRTKVPPPPSLGDAVKLLVNYFTTVRKNPPMRRPLYRFILRTFLLYPAGAPLENASQVFSLWVSYLEPWKIVRREDVDPAAGICAASSSCIYTDSWKPYVLSSYPFYTSMVMHFAGFAHKFLHADPESVTGMVSKLLGVLTSSKELTELLRKADLEFHGGGGGNGMRGLIPDARQELKDWEMGVYDCDADRGHSNRLFEDGEYGGRHLLQLFVLRAEAELQEMSNPESVRVLQSVKSQLRCLWGGGGDVRTKEAAVVTEEGKVREEGVFMPTHGGVYFYRGDRMERPIEEDEVPWLANLLIWLSSWVNRVLGLDRRAADAVADGKLTYVERGSEEYGMRESLHLLRSSLLMVGLRGLGLMRTHGVRVNLRFLASKKLVVAVAVLTLVTVLRNLFFLP